MDIYFRIFFFNFKFYETHMPCQIYTAGLFEKERSSLMYVPSVKTKVPADQVFFHGYGFFACKHEAHRTRIAAILNLYWTRVF